MAPVPRLAAQIRQSKPMALEVEAFLNLIRSADALSRGEASLLKEHGLGLTQYNVLRILRGAGDVGLTCSEVSARLIAKDPDVTRVMDRLVRQGLASRVRDRRDRRVILSSITADGLALLAKIDAPLNALHKRQLGHLSKQELTTLSELLEKARAPIEEA